MWFLAVSTSYQCELIELISTAIEQLPVNLVVFAALSHAGLESLPPELIDDRVVERREVV